MVLKKSIEKSRKSKVAFKHKKVITVSKLKIIMVQ